MDPEKEEWILEQLALGRRGAAELSRLRSELYFHYRDHVSAKDAQRRLDKRVRETEVRLARGFASDPKAALAPEPKPRNKGGREPNVSPRVEAAMRAIPRQELADMKNANMEARFGASLPTVRTARRKVLGEKGEKN